MVCCTDDMRVLFLVNETQRPPWQFAQYLQITGNPDSSVVLCSAGNEKRTKRFVLKRRKERRVERAMRINRAWDSSDADVVIDRCTSRLEMWDGHKFQTVVIVLCFVHLEKRIKKCALKRKKDENAIMYDIIWRDCFRAGEIPERRDMQLR